MTDRFWRPLTLLALVLAVLGALLVAPGGATAEPGKADPPRSERAEQALAAVEEILAGTPGAAYRRGTVAGEHDLTMAMRDLFMARDDLTGKDRKRADSILARPTSNEQVSPYEPKDEPKYCVNSSCPQVKRTCSGKVCVHFVKRGAHATNWHYAAAVRDAATKSHKKFRNWGYRGPFPDPGGWKNGGNHKRDIYLVDLGRHMNGVLGYAVPEYSAGPWDLDGDKVIDNWGASGYAVVDNDYSEFCDGGCGSQRVRKFMKATVAHEYFHLVQFGYDFSEDPWFMEATATWIEDEVFDGVNDSRYYLASPDAALKAPRLSLDSPFALPYANWIFFRFLSERYGRKVVRNMWRRADGWTGWGGGRTPPDQHSMQAIRNTVDRVGGKWSRDLGLFYDANRRTGRYYEEGWAYPNSPLKATYALWRGQKRKVRKPTLDHVSGVTFRVKPGNLKKNWNLRVAIEGPTNNRGFAVATIKRRDGRLQKVKFRLGGNGQKVREIPFGRNRVRWVEISLANTSVRYDCWTGGGYSCNGDPRDDNQRFKLVTQAVRP